MGNWNGDSYNNQECWIDIRMDAGGYMNNPSSLQNDGTSIKEGGFFLFWTVGKRERTASGYDAASSHETAKG